MRNQLSAESEILASCNSRHLDTYQALVSGILLPWNIRNDAVKYE
jgi:hypothetical protein